MLDNTKNNFQKALEHMEGEFSKLQMGRANPAMLDEIRIDQYGSLQALKNIASINTLDPQTLSIVPWDKTVIHAIATAITNSGLGLNPQTMADSIMIKVPPMTEERRRESAKIAKNMLEDGKISIRNVRGDAIKDIKKAKDNDEISEDDVKAFEKDLQKMVDDANKMADEAFKKKEADIMKV